MFYLDQYANWKFYPNQIISVGKQFIVHIMNNFSDRGIL